MAKYTDSGWCSSCGKYWPLDKAHKVYFKKLGVYSYYCPIHRKQLRRKARSTPMSTVKEAR
jgi:hypothetical protein